MKLLAYGLIMYADKNNGVYPDPNNWCDNIFVYAPNKKMFVCPGAESREVKYSYGLNPQAKRLGSKPSEVVLLFETDGGKNAFGGLEDVRKDRHGRGANFAFNDGHVEFVLAEDMNNLEWVSRLPQSPSAPSQ